MGAFSDDHTKDMNNPEYAYEFGRTEARNLGFETKLDLLQIELDEIGKMIKELEKSLNQFAETLKVGK